MVMSVFIFITAAPTSLRFGRDWAVLGIITES